MHRLERAGMYQLQPYSCLTEVVHLLVETAHVYAAFVIHEDGTYETYLEAGIAYAYAKVNILAHHVLESSDSVVHLFG